MGAEIHRPENSFFKLIEKHGYPSRNKRFCCGYLKEYKVLDKAVVGVRRSESRQRNERYKEPTQCRVYSKTERVEQIYPILDWTDKDIADFVSDRKIKCHHLYYDDCGNFHVERRLGCMACPLIYYRKRVEEFRKHPGLLKLWLKAGQKFLDTHKDSKTAHRYRNSYQWFVRELFFRAQNEFDSFDNSMFEHDYKKYLEDYFNIKL